MHTNTNGIPSSAGDHPHYAPGWTFQKPKAHMCKHTCGGKILWTNSPHCKHTVVDTATGNRLTEMLLCLEAKQTETTHPQQSSVSLTTSTWCIENSLSVTSCRGWKSPYKYSCLAKQLVIFVLNKENPILIVQRQRKQQCIDYKLIVLNFSSLLRLHTDSCPDAGNAPLQTTT